MILKLTQAETGNKVFVPAAAIAWLTGDDETKGPTAVRLLLPSENGHLVVQESADAIVTALGGATAP